MEEIMSSDDLKKIKLSIMRTLGFSVFIALIFTMFFWISLGFSGLGNILLYLILVSFLWGIFTYFSVWKYYLDWKEKIKIVEEIQIKKKKPLVKTMPTTSTYCTQKSAMGQGVKPADNQNEYTVNGKSFSIPWSDYEKLEDGDFLSVSMAKHSHFLLKIDAPNN